MLSSRLESMAGGLAPLDEEDDMTGEDEAVWRKDRGYHDNERSCGEENVARGTRREEKI